jgi:hypothetical protein
VARKKGEEQQQKPAVPEKGKKPLIEKKVYLHWKYTNPFALALLSDALFIWFRAASCSVTWPYTASLRLILQSYNQNATV